MKKRAVVFALVLLILTIAGCRETQPVGQRPAESSRSNESKPGEQLVEGRVFEFAPPDEPRPPYEPFVARLVQAIEKNAASIRILVHPEGGSFFTFAKDSSMLPKSREHGAHLTEQDAAALAKLLAGDSTFFWQTMTADGPPNTFILIYGPDINLQAGLGSKKQAVASLSQVRDVLRDAAARNLMGKIVEQLRKQIRRATKPKNWDSKLEKVSRDCVFVVLGRVTRVISNTHPPEGRTVSLGTITVKRHLKGTSDVKTIEAEFRFPSYLDVKPDTDDMILFVRKKLDSGRFLIVDWKWGKDFLDWILGIIARVDKTTRIPNMPKPLPAEVKKGITVTIGADDGQGRALAAVRAKSLKEIKVLAQFENHAEKSQSVMPCLEGSILHWRYPHYDLYILDANGTSMPRQGFFAFGYPNALRARDIVSLKKGEVFRTRISTNAARCFTLTPGKYRMRLIYTAKRDTSGIRLREPEVKDLIKAVWEGTAVSNWIDVEILSD